MRLRALAVGVALSFAACATPRTAPPPAAPVPQPTVPQPPTTAPAVSALTEAPRDWQLEDEATDHVPGISVTRAYQELLKGQQPQRTVVVAVIDGGVDTAHADLRGQLWTNPKEVAGNGKDDDGNGYVDDIHGWNFIGGPKGDVHYDQLEVTRLYVGCQKGTVPASEKANCPAIQADFQKQRDEASQTLQQVKTIGDALTGAVEILKKALGTDSLTTANVSGLQATGADVDQAKRIFLQLAANGITPQAVDDAREEYETQLKYGLNPDYESRQIVGDDYTDLTQHVYGNADYTGPDARHGTHVSGIIAATRGNGVGIDGIAPAKIMVIRTVPDGDERDKDVANAIRYAVDNGANVINMSFGKPYSPYKSAVDEAVKYADAHGVLMVVAAGNDGKDIDQTPDYPSPTYLNGGKAANWIFVGASSWKGGDKLAASFSNYGKQSVDVFAPGVDVFSSVQGGGYERLSGTSMATPVVTGLAALLMDYFPNMSAADVKRVILQSATRYDQPVQRPGDNSGQTVPFSQLSATGGVVNAYQAIKMAQRLEHSTP